MSTAWSRTCFDRSSLGGRLAAGNTPRGFIIKGRAGAAVPVASRRALLAEELRSAEYAVISTPTGQQLVEEGKWFALRRDSAVKASSAGGLLRFPALAVKQTNGEFVKGKPFLSDWIVEAELVDEQAFALQASSDVSGPSNLLGKVLVTKITQTEESRRRIEEVVLA